MNNFNDDTRQCILKRVAELAPVLERLPGVSIVHDLRDGTVLYMSPGGLEQLGVSMEELTAMGPDYHDRFFNVEEARIYVPQMVALVERNDPKETFTFFQQVKFANDNSWHWHLSSIRLLQHNNEGIPIASLTLAQLLTPEQHNTHKVDRLLEELQFIRTNLKTYSALGRSERNVLKLLALGRTAIQISEELHISVHTVDTHRKNIRKKLGAKTQAELDRYARAFDLV
jgi:DNA-binding CsgD family transcriptional regulator